MHRILFHIGPFTIYSYGVMLALAFVLGACLAHFRAKKNSLEPDTIVDLIIYILISGILGARILFVSLNWDYYQNAPLEIFKVWEGGLVFYGGFISSFLFSIWFLKRHKLPFFKVADILAPVFALGIAVGRIGCFLNGCCYGKVSYSQGIRFPVAENSPIISQQISQGLISSAARFSLPVLPTQLYESVFCLIIFLILLALERKKRFDGFLFWVFVFLYSSARFAIESLRFYESNFILFNSFTVSQLISIVLSLVSAAILINKTANLKRRE